MRIAVDARELEGKPTGVGRFIAEVLRRWPAEVFSKHEVFLYSKSALGRHPEILTRPFRLKPAAGVFKTDLLWEAALPFRLRQDRIDVFWGAGGSCGFFKAGVPTVVTIHDLAFFKEKRWFPPREFRVRRFRCAAAARIADRVLADSDATRRDLEARFPFLRGRVRTVYLGADHCVAAGRPSRNRERRVLFVGSILNRRLVGNLVTAVGMLKDRYPEISLVVIGENRTWPRVDFEELAGKQGLSDRVFFGGYAHEAELARHWEEAEVFCFPSLWEGFGIPILEAQRHGTPVVTLKNSSLEEIAGDSVCYAPSGRPEDLADCLAGVIADPALRSRLAERGMKNSARFSWDRTSRDVLAALEETAGKRLGSKGGPRWKV